MGDAGDGGTQVIPGTWGMWETQWTYAGTEPWGRAAARGGSGRQERWLGWGQPCPPPASAVPHCCRAGSWLSCLLCHVQLLPQPGARWDQDVGAAGGGAVPVPRRGVGLGVSGAQRGESAGGAAHLEFIVPQLEWGTGRGGVRGPAWHVGPPSTARLQSVPARWGVAGDPPRGCGCWGVLPTVLPCHWTHCLLPSPWVPPQPPR